MGVQNWILDKLRAEFGDAYGAALWADQQSIIKLYNYYDGKGQDWPLPANLDYAPTKIIANKTKHLIKEEARFMLSRAPEISIVPVQNSEDSNINLCAELEGWLRQLLDACGWVGRLSRAGRDLFVGKRLALKLIGGQSKPLGVRLLPSLEFAFDMDCESGCLTKIMYYYHKTHDTDPKHQRTWVQRYWMEQGRSWMEQGVYDGYGVRQSEEYIAPALTGLDFIPSAVIINDGLTGDIKGESDIDVLIGLADAYNRRLSDDQDALKFNMFPQRVFKDVEENCLENVKISPGSMLDIQSSVTGDHQASADIMETQFSYDGRFEHSVDRLDDIMHEQLSIPKTSIDQLKALGVSGKAMKMLYNPLIARCEEKWQAWDEAIRWMVRSLVSMAQISGGPDYSKAKYTVSIEHLWPIPNDDEEERVQDRLDVQSQTMSRKAYIDKWRPTADPVDELKQMVIERQQLEESSYL